MLLAAYKLAPYEGPYSGGQNSKVRGVYLGASSEVLAAPKYKPYEFSYYHLLSKILFTI